MRGFLIMEKIRIGINGFGRIGRSLARVLVHHPDIELVAINDLADKETLAHLLKYDSVHGRFPGEVELINNKLFIDGKEIATSHAASPDQIDWDSNDVQIVIESTGKFKSSEEASQHLSDKVKKVIISAPPSDDETKMIVLGVNP